MSRKTASLEPAYFDDLYRKDADPWGFRSSAYEREKYADTLTALTKHFYSDVLEVGCSIGVFTRLLAPRCERLTAIDPSALALATAREACADCKNVTFEQRGVPEGMPDGPYDLIVLSEVLYYLDQADAELTSRLCCQHVAPGGEVVLCHWLGESDYPLTGDEAADIFLKVAATVGMQTETFPRGAYRLDRATWKDA